MSTRQCKITGKGDLSPTNRDERELILTATFNYRTMILAEIPVLQ
jgi:hypothetical protein